MKKYLFSLLCIGCICLACNKTLKPDPDPDPGSTVKELKLSVEGIVETDDLEYEFEILEGNGNYTVKISEGDLGRAVIEGMKVKVTLLQSSTGVTVTDGKEQSRSVVINSSAGSLVPISYSIYLEIKDGPITMKHIDFGAGGYSLEKIKGTSAEATVQENDWIYIRPLTQGNTYFKIIDKRGSKAYFTILVGATYTLVNNMLNVEAINDQTFSVILQYGAGGWRIEPQNPPSPIIKEIHLTSKEGSLNKYDVLQVYTSSGNVKGTASVHLKDSTGNTAVITITVK